MKRMCCKYQFGVLPYCGFCCVSWNVQAKRAFVVANQCFTVEEARRPTTQSTIPMAANTADVNVSANGNAARTGMAGVDGDTVLQGCIVIIR